MKKNTDICRKLRFGLHFCRDAQVRQQQ